MVLISCQRQCTLKIELDTTFAPAVHSNSVFYTISILWQLGEYSTYLSHDGAQTPSVGTYADMYYGYAAYGVPTLGHDGQIYGSQNYQYPSTYSKQHNSIAKMLSNGRSEKLAPAPEGDVSTTGVDEVKGLKNPNSTLKAHRNTPGRQSSLNTSKWIDEVHTEGQ